MESGTRRERERTQREAEIVAAAERIFCEKGFESASMDEIASAAQFTKRTVYLYFKGKEELFFAAALNGFLKLFAALQAASPPGATGYQKILEGYRAYYVFYRENPGVFRMINEVGAVKSKAKTETPGLKELLRFDNELFRWVADNVAGGKADGSIREDLDPVMATFSIIFMMTGFFNQLSLNGKTFLDHFSLDPEEFSDYSMQLLLGSIRR